MLWMHESMVSTRGCQTANGVLSSVEQDSVSKTLGGAEII